MGNKLKKKYTKRNAKRITKQSRIESKGHGSNETLNSDLQYPLTCRYNSWTDCRRLKVNALTAFFPKCLTGFKLSDFKDRVNQSML